MVVETGAGRDEANLVGTRVHKMEKSLSLKWRLRSRKAWEQSTMQRFRELGRSSREATSHQELADTRS